MSDSNIPETIPGALLRAAERWPDSEALVDGDVRLTFAEYCDAAFDTARALIAAGIKPGDRVGLWAPNSIEYAATAFGVYFAGAVLVPLNTRYKAAEAADILRRSRAAAVFAFSDLLGTDYLGSLHENGVLDDVDLAVNLRGPETASGLTRSAFLALGETVSRETVLERIAALEYDSVSDIQFTSGTTGWPKGAMLMHGTSVRGYTEYLNSVSIRNGDRVLGVPPYFHIYGLKAGLLACVLAGACMYPVTVFDIVEVGKLIGDEQITVVQGPPPLHMGLLDDPRVDRSRLKSIRISSVGSAGFAPENFARIRDELGSEELGSAYGLTETHGIVTRSYPHDDFDTVAFSSGRPVPGIEVRILDDNGAEAAAGEAGEITVRGFTVMKGYFEDPEATRKAIDEEGWLHTGDVGLIDDQGRLCVLDRRTDMFLVGGFNTYPAEIERILMTHGGLAEVAVVGVPDERLGKVGMVYAVRKPDAHLEADELIAWARENLANFKVPRYVEFLEQLPRNASGKVQKFKLASEDEQGPTPNLPTAASI
ncbi:AMP-binding protein [Nocardioides sp. WS12]|uniref:AMP-binding protein n=1 Tax=Nocardioides sp. WS12 TaxID=2486272 RepID=UPI0015FDEEC6|nr:AMP-binding protein [Nocardioides sp. WS12]